MTKLLEQAFAQASQLPEQEQDAIAALALQELASDQRWDTAFANSQDALAMLADEALSEDRQGGTKPLTLV